MSTEEKKKKIIKGLLGYQKKQSDAYKTYIKTSAVGLEFGLSIVVGALGGYFADRYLHSSPWGLIIGVVIGSVAGVKRLLVFTKSYLKNEHEKNDDRKT